MHKTKSKNTKYGCSENVLWAKEQNEHISVPLRFILKRDGRHWIKFFKTVVYSILFLHHSWFNISILLETQTINCLEETLRRGNLLCVF